MQKYNAIWGIYPNVCVCVWLISQTVIFRSKVVISTQEQRKWVRRSDSDDALTLLDHFSSLVGEAARLINSLKVAEAPGHIFSRPVFYCFYKFLCFRKCLQQRDRPVEAE